MHSRSRSRSRSPRRSTPPLGLSRRYRNEEIQESTTLFVGNLSYNIRERELNEFMEKFGRVRSVTVGNNRRTGASKGYGFVEFETHREAEEAHHKLQGYDLDGRKLRLDWDLGLDKKERRTTRRHSGYRRSSYRSYSRSRSPPRRRRSPSPRRERRRSPSRSASRSPRGRRFSSRDASPKRSPRKETSPRSPDPKRSKSPVGSPSPKSKRN